MGYKEKKEMYNQKNIKFKVILCLIVSLVFSGCSAVAPTATAIPPTETQIPSTATPTVTPSATPEPALTAETKELLQSFGNYFSNIYFLKNENWKKTSIEYLLETAATLNIELSEEELNFADVPEQEKVVQRIENEILNLYGTTGQALFAVGYYGNLPVDRLLFAHRLEYVYIDEMREAIAKAAHAEEEVVNAAKLLSLDNEVIAQGEMATKAIQELLDTDLPTKDAIYAAFEKALFFRNGVDKALQNISD
jgi:hypothetical protein